MITAELIKEQIVAFANKKLDVILGKGLLAKSVRPAIVIYINNNIDRLDPILNFISDKDGNVDIINLINQYEETILNDAIINSYDVFGGKIELGQGKIKIIHKYLDKNQVLTVEDVNEFKELLNPKKAKKDVSEA